MGAAEAQLAKAKVTQTREMIGSKPAREHLAKKQQERGGVGRSGSGRYRLQATGAEGESPGEIKKSDGRIRTIYDMVEYYYGFLPDYVSKQGDSSITKADDPVTTTSDPSINNAVYGSEVFSMLNSEQNAYALLSKRPWTRSGVRIVTDYGHGEASGGIEENAALPETDHPEWDRFEVEPKNVSHTFDVSQVEQLLSDTEDDNLEDPFDWLRQWYGTGTEHQENGEHPKHINEQLLAGVDDTGPSQLGFDSIDRMISNAEESSILTDASNNDVFDFDRSSNEFESNVLHNSGTPRDFHVSLMDTAIRQVKEESGKNPVKNDNYFWLTGHDTYQRIEDEFGGKERLDHVRTTTGMNGVETEPGDDVGIMVRAYKNVPIFEANDVVKDGVSRMYLVDSSTMFIKQLLPTQFYSTGIDVDDNPFGINRLGNEGMYLTIGELTTTTPVGHAKVRDLA